jgi:hypothetical protein
LFAHIKTKFVTNAGANFVEVFWKQFCPGVFPFFRSGFEQSPV